MAYLEKRGKKWMAQVFHQGRRTSKTFLTKTAAMEWAAALERSNEAGDRGELPEKTFSEMLDRYRLEVTPSKGGARWESLRILKISRESPFKHRLCHKVTTDDIGAWRDIRLSQIKPASVRREVAILDAVFERAKNEWHWVRTNPVKGMSLPPKPPARKRGIKQGEINAILRILKWHGEASRNRDQVSVAFLLAIETAMRKGELLSLSPETVNLKDKVAHLPKTKNGDARDVPLSGCAVDLLKLIGCKFSIGEKSLDVTFRRYRDRAGIENLHFHDTRSEAISRLSKKMDVLELAQMVGHRDLKSLMFYYKRSAAEIAKKL